MAKPPKKRMTKKEIEDWDALYMYVKNNVLKYEEDMKMPQYMTLRLKGMTEGKFMVNNNSKETANYSYEIILTTFKICNPEIQRALRSVEFSDEQHKFNYIMKIIDSNINDVYMRSKKVEQIKEEVRAQVEAEAEIPKHVGAKFKPRKKKKDRFAEFW